MQIGVSVARYCKLLGFVNAIAISTAATTSRASLRLCIKKILLSQREYGELAESAPIHVMLTQRGARSRRGGGFAASALTTFTADTTSTTTTAAAAVTGIAIVDLIQCDVDTQFAECIGSVVTRTGRNGSGSSGSTSASVGSRGVLAAVGEGGHQHRVCRHMVVHAQRERHKIGEVEGGDDDVRCRAREGAVDGA